MSLGKALLTTGLASLTVLGSVGAANSGQWSFSFRLLILPLVAFLLGSLVVVWVRRTGGSMEAGAMAGAVCAALLVGGGYLIELFGPFGVLVVAVLTGTTYVLLRRLLPVFNLDWLGQWVLLALVLINGAYLVQIVSGDLSASNGIIVHGQSPPQWEEYPDVAVIILDEFASLEAAPLLPGHESKVRSLEEGGFETRETIWSSYTVSSAAIPAILHGDYPLEDGDVIDDAALSRLGAISRGRNRLAATLKTAGYRFTMMESGLWMSSCGPEVDRCVEGSWLNEMMGILLERSAIAWWYRQFYGHSFLESGLASMEETQRVLVDAAGNDEPDLIFAHVMLPHIPYLVDDMCRRHGVDPDSFATRAERHAAYQLQAGCVVDWLVEMLAEVDDVSTVPPMVVVAGDHGTNFSGQLTRPVADWSRRDLVERLGTFAVFRFRDDCSTDEIQSTPQLVDGLLACLEGTEANLDRRHFLSSYGQDQVQVIEYPPEALDAASLAEVSDP